MATIGKNAIVTGASRGIGRAVAEALLQEGYSVAICSRSEDDLKQTAAELVSPDIPSDRVFARVVDVSDERSVKQFVGQVLERWSGVDILVNNAGINQQGTWSGEVRDYRAQLEVNTLGPFLFTKEVVPGMIKRKQGQIINIGSICSFVGFAGVGTYTASKFALRGWNESLFRELAPQGIRVTLLAPSWVDTPMAKHSPVPPAERIQPADIARTIRYLLSLSRGAAVRELVIECSSDIS